MLYSLSFPDNTKKMYSTIYFLICMLSSAHFPSHQLSTEIQFMGEGSSALLLPSILSDNGATDLEVSSVFIPLFWHFHFDIDNCSYFIWLWVKYNKKDSCLITNGSTVCKKKLAHCDHLKSLHSSHPTDCGIEKCPRISNISHFFSLQVVILGKHSRGYHYMLANLVRTKNSCGVPGQYSPFSLCHL